MPRGYWGRWDDFCSMERQNSKPEYHISDIPQCYVIHRRVHE